MSNMQHIATAEVGFGLDVYNELIRAQPNDNAFFSPLSLLLALAMTLLGAQENFLTSFNESCHKFYGSYLQLVDFKNKASECELIVNNWVQQKTNNKIKNLIPQGTFNQLTTIVLVNVLHFKGSWHKHFRKSATAEKNFKISQDQTISAPFMNFNNEKIKYYYDDTLESQVLQIPFIGNTANFIVILPNLTKTSLPEMKKKLTSDVIKKISEKVSNWLKAYIEISEEGVEAAAATAVIGMRTSSRVPSLPRVEVNADRPFVFLIKESTLGAVLFMGRLKNPK
ncbi:hypothetical protein HELRODRAFT_178820 [Helobdella robusta]|uniref:Serpin domain-containing protein n=1 Tax=Helobdella robusta TaxID=6412 RepID=T1FDS6_HELRO|nr:hypothetical protein HELRODRAFT_178820 [Helobdella robusta]ESN95904.1 hypothetical protein HELRODRAFT_178820 [Helobdella robusta]